jgi:hypothetical protein
MNALRMLAATIALVIPTHAAALELISNGGFEAGFAGWTRADQLGSEGTFALQTGTTSPVNALPVPPPPEGVQAAMTDAMGPGSHLLYQDFLVPTLVSNATLSFMLFVNNQAPDFFTPPHLDFATPDLNQQARVDILGVGADPFSVAAADVLFNAFATLSGDPLVSGYLTYTFDLTALLNGNLGQTLRLRFAEVDNVFLFNLGVDAVRLVVNEQRVPEPATWLLVAVGAVAAARVRRPDGRRR